jgi:hypothetical protein
MAQKKRLARGTLIDVSDGGATPVFLRLDWKSATYDEARTFVDVSSQANAGWVEELAAGGQLTLNVENTYLVDADGTTRDPAQARIETLARLFGPAAVGIVKITEINGDTVEFNANFKISPWSGGEKDGAKWACEIKSSGAPTFSAAT